MNKLLMHNLQFVFSSNTRTEQFTTFSNKQLKTDKITRNVVFILQFIIYFNCRTSVDE